MLGLDGWGLVKVTDICNGNVLVKLDVFSGKDSGSDAVALRLASVLTHHHLQKFDALLDAYLPEQPERSGAAYP